MLWPPDTGPPALLVLVSVGDGSTSATVAVPVRGGMAVPPVRAVWLVNDAVLLRVSGSPARCARVVTMVMVKTWSVPVVLSYVAGKKKVGGAVAVKVTPAGNAAVVAEPESGRYVPVALFNVRPVGIGSANAA